MDLDRNGGVTAMDALNNRILELLEPGELSQWAVWRKLNESGTRISYSGVTSRLLLLGACNLLCFEDRRDEKDRFRVLYVRYWRLSGVGQIRLEKLREARKNG